MSLDLGNPGLRIELGARNAESRVLEFDEGAVEVSAQLEEDSSMAENSELILSDRKDFDELLRVL